MQKKNEVCKRFENLCDLVKTQFDISVKCLHSDNGGEYENSAMRSLCADRGI
ncbi:hypothetical protein GGH98_005027, partial [Coemansia sp. RSA 454]